MRITKGILCLLAIAAASLSVAAQDYDLVIVGSHIGFSTLRMEPCWMAFGQAAGAAAAIAIDSDAPVQDVAIDTLQRRLLDEGATLIYFDDMHPGHEGFADAQRLGLAGKIPGWSARDDRETEGVQSSR